jgi:hypothetical protein
MCAVGRYTAVAAATRAHAHAAFHDVQENIFIERFLAISNASDETKCIGTVL